MGIQLVIGFLDLFEGFLGKNLEEAVKLWFIKMLFVGFYSVPNLIVILFNLLYPVFVVGFICKGCVLERESVCEDSSNWSQKISRGYLVTKLPARWSMCLAHDWNAKSQYRMEIAVSREYLSSKAFLRDTRETFCSERKL